MDQHGRAGIAGRIEISQPLRRTRAVQHDVDDDIAALVAGALQFQPERLAQQAAAAIRGDDPVGLHRVGARGRLNRQPRAILARVDRGDAVLPANLDQVAALLGGIEQQLLDRILREIDHRRMLLVFIHRHLEMQHFVVAIETAATGPGQALLQKALGGGEARDDFEAAPRDADRAAAEADGIIRFQQNDRHAMAGEPERRAIADRSAADHHDGMPRLIDAAFKLRQRRRMLLGRKGIGLERAVHESSP